MSENGKETVWALLIMGGVIVYGIILFVGLAAWL